MELSIAGLLCAIVCLLFWIFIENERVGLNIIKYINYDYI